MRILKNNCAAIALDIQSKLFPFIYNNTHLEQIIIKLIKGLNVLGVPIITTEQYSRGLGNTLQSIRDVLTDYRPIEKATFSCCGSDNFNAALTELNKPFIVIFGIESHVCVLQTAIDLLALNFTPVIIEDAVASRNPNDKSFAINRLISEGAVVSTYESILFELCQASDNDFFKPISKIVK